MGIPTAIIIKISVWNKVIILLTQFHHLNIRGMSMFNWARLIQGCIEIKVIRYKNQQLQETMLIGGKMGIRSCQAQHVLSNTDQMSGLELCNKMVEYSEFKTHWLQVDIEIQISYRVKISIKNLLRSRTITGRPTLAPQILRFTRV